jgi:ankyrin repeat protein
MLGEGADPDYLGPEGETALMAAIQNDRSPAPVSLLLEHNAKVSICAFSTIDKC